MSLEALEQTSGEVELDDIDVHFARTIARLARCDRAELAAAAALASRATADGDVCVRLADFAGRSVPAFGVIAPGADDWMRLLRECDVVGEPGSFRPLVLDGAGRLYLHRYWDYERRVADDLSARAVDAGDVNDKLLRDGLKRYFPDADDIQQKLAAATAVLRRFCVISGGPGTGKTTTVVKILALLAEQAQRRNLAIGVAAPTGKAAARVQDAIASALDKLDLDLFAKQMMPKGAGTLHRLLGARPDSVYYRHNRANPLGLDVLVVDEASMADLALFAKLLDALPARARLILLGDKDQLASVEAGAVLGDICAGSGHSAAFAKRLAAVTGIAAAKIPRGARDCALADSVALLDRSYRFGPESGIGSLARAVNAGDGDAALALLTSGAQADIAWGAVSGASDLRARLAAHVVDALREYFEAVRAGADPQEIFARFNAFRVLCAHRRGAFGAIAVNRIIEDALDEQGSVSARNAWYPGRPVMITRNDYNVRLFNGDVGIALPDADGRVKVYFVGESVRSFAPSRLPDHETVYAMTIHKSQGSEFGRVLMLLPPEMSPIMSRELVYTGITRAKSRVEIWGDAAVFREAVGRRLTRASALQERLWRTA
ncbi:MAG TPA: exodeoxyribonuclease V subunit alpha [Burkholderiales bacterium]|nr:exodeoxyribonuclease V subunit alpha [Burkholderiales bacterium]